MEIKLPKQVQKNINRFSGRAWLLPKVMEWYHRTDARLLLVTGAPGTGKSMFSAWLAGFGKIPTEQTTSQLLESLRNEVRGAHFCQYDSMSISPKQFAINLNSQFSAGILPFDEAFTGSLPELIRVNAQQRLQGVSGSVTATNVKIGDINLGSFGPVWSFEQLLYYPLIELYHRGYKEKMLILVDSLDEAAFYHRLSYGSGSFDEPGGATFDIIEGLRRFGDLPEQVRILATLRPDPRLLERLVDADIIDLADPASDDRADQQEAELKRADVGTFVFDQLAGIPPKRRKSAAKQVAQAAGGNFLVADRITQKILPILKHGPLPDNYHFPADLKEYYQLTLAGELHRDDSTWERFRPLLGLLAVATPPGLKRAMLEALLGREVLLDLRACKPLLVGSMNDGPFIVFHKSLADYLLTDPANQSDHIDAWRMYKLLADALWAGGNGLPDWSAWGDMDYRAIPQYLTGAMAANTREEQNLQASRLVRLVGNAEFQKRYLIKVKDQNELVKTVNEGLRSILVLRQTAVLPLVAKAAIALYDFRQARLAPDAIFQLSEKGRKDEAVRLLAELDPDKRWRDVALLVIAWLTAQFSHKQAHDLHAQVLNSGYLPSPLPLLAQRVATRWGETEPVLGDLPPHALASDQVDKLLIRLGGEKATVADEASLNEYLNSAEQYINSEMIASALSEMADTNVTFKAQNDGPALVRYAVEDQKRGWEKFAQYLRILSANQYTSYRNLALWFMLDAVLRHPDANWTLRAVREIVGVVFKKPSMAFREGLPVSVLALSAGQEEDKALQAKAFQELDHRRQVALVEAAELDEMRRHSDRWGEHKRRLCALAQAFSRLPSIAPLRQSFQGIVWAQTNDDAVDELLRWAINIPRGFAGFLYSAWFTVAETILICHREGRFSPLDALNNALDTAFHIQDVYFCSRATAHVRTMLEQWWPVPSGKDLTELVQRFTTDPSAAEFAPIYAIGEQFGNRQLESNLLPIPPNFSKANTLNELQLALQLPRDQLLALNPEYNPSTVLELPTYVRLPDPGFAPLLAARLAAEVTARTELLPEDKQVLIQKLVPIAATDRTVLDTVLASLALAAEIDEPQKLGEF